MAPSTRTLLPRRGRRECGSPSRPAGGGARGRVIGGPPGAPGKHRPRAALSSLARAFLHTRESLSPTCGEPRLRHVESLVSEAWRASSPKRGEPRLRSVESLVSEAWRASHREPRLTRTCSPPAAAGRTSRRSERAPCRHAPAPSRPARVESRERVPTRAPFLAPKVVTPPPARRKPVSGGGHRARLPSRSQPRALHAPYPHLSRVASALVAPLIRTCRVLHPHFSHAVSALVAIWDRIGLRLRPSCLRPRTASQTIAAVATEHHPAQGRHPPPPACGRGIQGEGGRKKQPLFTVSTQHPAAAR